MPKSLEQDNSFYGKDFITVNGLKRADIDYIFRRADLMKGIDDTKQTWDVLKNHAVPIIFFEPSTRTFLSFCAAATRLGANVHPMPDMPAFSSVAKGESFTDTIKAVENATSARAIVLRHHDEDSSKTAARVAEAPVINGGSGQAEHPTQALLDLYTIQESLGRIDGLKIALVGDLKYGRTVKSLASLAATIGENNQLFFVSAEQLRFPQKFLDTLPDDVQYEETSNLESVIRDVDVVYMTRTQKERFSLEEQDLYETLSTQLTLTREMAETMQFQSIIMHPLPRTRELRYGVDENPRAVYFKQMTNGLYIRMALLESIMIEQPRKEARRRTKNK